MLPRPTKPTVATVSLRRRVGAHGLDLAPGRRPRRARRSTAAIWNSSSSTSSSVTPVCAVLLAWRRNSSIRPSAAVIAITSRLRSRVRERAAAGPHAPRHRREVVLELGRDRVGVGGRRGRRTRRRASPDASPVPLGAARSRPWCARGQTAGSTTDVHAGGAAVGHARLAPHLDRERHVHQRVAEPQQVRGVVGQRVELGTGRGTPWPLRGAGTRRRRTPAARPSCSRAAWRSARARTRGTSRRTARGRRTRRGGWPSSVSSLRTDRDRCGRARWYSAT